MEYHDSKQGDAAQRIHHFDSSDSFLVHSVLRCSDSFFSY
jgi:hypothetical protein